ncbi:ATP-dependent nuclease [Micromonospora sp. DT81.3]|uniref:ATP-dependent nuclease n=1 Tax=Micromonospora sp. DT81.3 TaxID=3416523 RepID=UPI003CFA9F13
MHLSRIEVEGYRASAIAPITCEFGGRFTLVVGANGAGKTTINEAIALSHPRIFPRLAPMDASALGPAPRAVRVEYAYETSDSEGALGEYRKSQGLPAPKWSRPLERSLGQVRAGRPVEPQSEYENMRLVHLPALRNPVDDLSRRDARILLELLRADDRRDPATGALRSLRAQAESMLQLLAEHELVGNVEGRIAENLRTISGGIQEHHAFVGTQTVDDTYLARVFEMLLALLPDRGAARRLQASSLGYVNLLHIAVTLAGIPDAGTLPARDAGPVSSPPTLDSAPDSSADAARARLADAAESADADADSFYPELFHATVLIEEPEAHLHPQLQYGLVRYLRRLVAQRPDIQVIVTTHSADLVAACDPEDVVIVRKDAAGHTLARRVADIPVSARLKTSLFQQTRLHLDATRSAALFGDRVLLVEGVTEASLLRLLGRVWAGDDDARVGFIDALSILPIGHKVGQWPIRMLASRGHELVTRVAALSDTDLRGDPLPDPAPPAWHAKLDPASARYFWSRPTLEPSLVAGNESLIERAFDAIELTKPASGIAPASVDAYFRANPKKKGRFSLALARLIDTDTSIVVVPEHIEKLFSWLFDGDEPG